MTTLPGSASKMGGLDLEKRSSIVFWKTAESGTCGAISGKLINWACGMNWQKCLITFRGGMTCFISTTVISYSIWQRTQTSEADSKTIMKILLVHNRYQ